MQTILTVVQLVLSLGLIGLVLIQHGRGADAGAAFGSGASATVFGARGSGSFLSRATAVLATLFFLTSMALAYYAAKAGKVEDLMDGVEIQEPVVPAEVPRVEIPPVPAPGDAGMPVVPAPVESPAPAPSVPAPAPVKDAPEVPAPAADSDAGAGANAE